LMKPNFLSVFLLLLLFLVPLQVCAQEDTPSVDLGQSRWNKTSLNVLLILDEDEPWWQPYFPNMTMRALQQWKDAFGFFAENYPQYGYLADLELTTATSNVSLPGFDIYIVFSPDVLISGVNALGETLVLSSSNGTNLVANVTLSAQSQVVDVTRQDYRDTAVHELGHALGLGHSNSSKDLMYPYNDIFSSGYAISTLDLYGVAVLFEPQNATVAAKPASFVVLPPEIAYTYAPINDPAPTSIGDNPVVKFFTVLVLNPTTLLLLVLLVAVIMLLIAVIVRRRKQRR